MSWGAVIGAGIGAMTGRRDNKQAQKQWRREDDAAEEAARIAYERQVALNEDQQAFEAQQASTAMQFSERMASTQHQREVNDLRAAGLNPILSGTGGMGAAAPVGVAGHAAGSSAAKKDVPKGTVFPTAQAVMAGAATGAQIEKTMAEIENIDADTENKRSQNPMYEIAQEKARRETENVMQDTRVKRALEGKTEAETEQVRALIQKVIADTRLSELQGNTELHRQRNLDRSSALMLQQEALTGVEARTAKSIESMDLNELSKLAPSLVPVLKMILTPKSR